MTDPPLLAHPDDEAFSALIDGEGAPRVAEHVSGCAACTSRVAALRGARGAVVAATVPTLPTAVLDGLVATAIAEGADVARASEVRRDDGPAPVGIGSRRRGRRVTTPPPAWLLGAVAAIAAIAGMAGLVQKGFGGDDEGIVANGRAEMTAEESTMGDASAATAAATADAAADPEVVRADLGEVADAAALTRVLSSGSVVAGRAAATGAGGGAPDAQAETEPLAGAPPGSVAPAPAPVPAGGGATGAAGPPDRARCRLEAERIGAGRLGALLTTATLRWAGRPAEVLVFALTEPAGGVSRQALVLARPGCELLADPRF